MSNNNECSENFSSDEKVTLHNLSLEKAKSLANMVMNINESHDIRRGSEIGQHGQERRSD